MDALTFAVDAAGNLAETVVKKGTLGKAISALSDVSSVAGQVVQTSRTLKTLMPVKDEFVKATAESSVRKIIGDTVSFSSEQEKAIQQFVDGDFRGIEGFLKRFKFNFIPSEFPSGEKIKFSRKLRNEILNTVNTNKSATLKYSNAQGDSVELLVSKQIVKDGETCFPTMIRRTAQDGSVEKATTFYYPKSKEILMVSTDKTGDKTIKKILGNADGVKIKQKNKSANV